MMETVCTISLVSFLLIWILGSPVGCQHLRLVDGGHRCDGRVEVYKDGQWGTVCATEWYPNDGKVVCNELNCGTYVQAYYSPAKSGPILLSGVQCSGTESALLDCQSDPQVSTSCTHETDLRVACSGWKVRLTLSRSQGRLEVNHGESWRTVCSQSVDSTDADVVCRDLSCGYSKAVLRGAHFGEGTGSIWADEIQCQGNERKLSDCPVRKINQHNCTHADDVGIICSDCEDLRLGERINPCVGIVNVLKNGQWGTVCHDGWTGNNGKVVCDQLNCGSHIASAPYSFDSSPIVLSGVDCNGTEPTLQHCTSDLQVSNCTQGNTVVQCSGDTVRLSGGVCRGRLEVNRGGTYKTVCPQSVDSRDADVVCRELGCGVSGAVLGGAVFGQGTGPIWADEIQCGGDEEKLSYCPVKKRNQQNCTHADDVSIVCFGYTDFRLVNGPDRCSGRLEMKYGGQWGTVCDRGWDLRDATVLCQQLQCGHAEAVLGPDRFGQGNGSVFTDVFDCEGTETALGQCPISPWTHSTCTNRSDLGVICSRAVGSVRLLGGESRCEGRVEVFYSGSWGRLQGQSGVGAVASVLCRQLDCGAAVQTTSSSRYGPGRSEVCLTGLRCSGNETHLQNCSRPQTETCGSGSDVGVLCEKHRALRVVGGEGPCAGRLEVYHSGSWGTVCDDSWDLADAQVVCRQLQCGTALTATALGFFGQVEGPIWLDEVRCEGNESSLWDCPARPWGQHDCSHKEDVAIMCSEFKQLRLVSEQFECAGRVEVFYNGTWGSVCMNSFNSFTANLICQQLNCGDYFSYDYAKEVSGLNRLDDIKCTKHHTSLWQCPSSPWGENNCDNGEVVEIICAGKINKTAPSPPEPCSEDPGQDHCPETDRLRLYGGHSNCSGRVEVLFWGTWGSVCDDSWDLRDAQVVCRQLGCGEAESAVGGAAWGEGNSTVWLDEVNCRGSELHLWDCEHPALGQSDCQHKEDAGVNCATMQSIQLSRGSSNCSGQVEVLFRGIWGSVCDDSWDLRDAQVVCRQLGCGEAESAVGGAASGEGNGTVWLDEVNCRGSELHLWDCEHPAPGLSRCQSQRRAAVRCAEPPKPRPLPPPPPPPQTQPGQFNLLIVCAALGALVFVAAVLALVQTLRYRDQKREFAQLETTFDPLQDGLYEEIDHKLHRQGTYSQYRAGSLLSEELSYDDVGAEGSAAAASLPASEDDYDDVKEEEDASVPEIKKEPPGNSSPDLDYHGYEEVEEPEVREAEKLN